MLIALASAFSKLRSGCTFACMEPQYAISDGKNSLPDLSMKE
ncbi:MAG: hypothetical protein ACI30R_00390 [Sodaliphilus sp.]